MSAPDLNTDNITSMSLAGLIWNTDGATHGTKLPVSDLELNGTEAYLALNGAEAYDDLKLEISQLVRDNYVEGKV